MGSAGELKLEEVGTDDLLFDATISTAGNAIRMVLHHFIEVKKCPQKAALIFKKASAGTNVEAFPLSQIL